jgi:hypothetical protein
MIEQLLEKIKSSYESGVTRGEAEKLAGEFLYAQAMLAETLKVSDLDARMQKSGLKAIRSAVRQEEIKKHDKKPTENHLEDVVNMDNIVKTSQDLLDSAEVERDYQKSIFDIFGNAHIHFRAVSRGSYE